MNWSQCVYKLSFIRKEKEIGCLPSFTKTQYPQSSSEKHKISYLSHLFLKYYLEMKGLAASLILGTAAAGLLPREFHIEEEVLLVDCGIGTLPDPTHSSSRQVAYYAHGFKNGFKPDMVVEVPWDGSYPWRDEGVDARFPNGDLFHFVIHPRVTDELWKTKGRYSGWAQHTYNEVLFQCKSDHGKPAFFLTDGTKCTTAFICLHDPEVSPPNDNKPSPDKEVSVANFTMSTESVNVRVQGTDADLAKWNPATAFGHIHEAIEGVQCKDRDWDIGNDCTISFACSFANPDTSALSSILTKVVAPSVEKTKTKKKGRYPGKCRPNGFCEPDYEFEYHVYEYPATGKILVSRQTEGKPDTAKQQSELAWKVECKDNGFCGGFCSGYNKEMVDALGGLVGLPPIAAIACSFC